MNHPRTLQSWFFETTAKPIYLMIGFMMVMQIIFTLYQNKVKFEEVRVSATSLSNILAVGLLQKNRLVIETGSAYAIANSGFKKICIYERGEFRYSIPFEVDKECRADSWFFFKEFDVILESVPDFRVKFIALRFPHWKDSIVLFLVSGLVCFPIYFILLLLVRKVDTHLITPLKESVGNLQIDGPFSKALSKFNIVELDDLMSSYVGKIEEIKELTERESQATRDAAIGRIITQLSHDLRAPLGSIEQLLYLPDDAALSSQKLRIRESIYRMNSMIESLRRADLELMIEPKIETLRFDHGLTGLIGKAKQKAIEIDIQNCYHGVRLLMDAPKFERAWVNLVSNALDAAKRKIMIVTEISGQDFFLRVVDDGPGVPEDFLPKLFQRGATHGKHDGTGLGLAYARQIMQGHGGDVGYRREHGQTIFECHLPNAVDQEKDYTMDNSEVFDAGLVQKLVRTVAICFEPESLSKSVLSEMASQKSDDFLFSGEMHGANIVVSNIDEVMFEILEGNEQEFIHVSPAWGDANGILARLKLKFNLS